MTSSHKGPLAKFHSFAKLMAAQEGARGRDWILKETQLAQLAPLQTSVYHFALAHLTIHWRSPLYIQANLGKVSMWFLLHHERWTILNQAALGKRSTSIIGKYTTKNHLLQYRCECTHDGNKSSHGYPLPDLYSASWL